MTETHELNADTSLQAAARIVGKVNEIAVLPQVVYKIVETTGNGDVSAAQIEREIIVDPGFSAKVLALANSASMALPKKVTSIRDAVMFLGTKQVRQLALTVGVFDLFVGKNDRESLRRRTWWRHSLDAAVCCKWLACQYPDELRPDEAYTCGLLHFIGRTILDRSDPQAYEKVMLATERGVPVRDAERHFFGCDHIQVSLGVAVKWGFPDMLAAGLNYTEPPSNDGHFARLRACVALGAALADMVIGGSSPTEDCLAPHWALALFGIEESGWDALVVGAAQAVATAKRAA